MEIEINHLNDFMLGIAREVWITEDKRLDVLKIGLLVITIVFYLPQKSNEQQT